MNDGEHKVYGESGMRGGKDCAAVLIEAIVMIKWAQSPQNSIATCKIGSVPLSTRCFD